jgi:hypothetical protein
VPGVSARTTPPHPVPGKAAIYAAIPGGSRRARSQRAYLAALVADPELAELRIDARRSVLEVARVLARWASWRTMTSWRPRARICAEVGSSRDPDRPLSVSTFKSCRRWLEDHGYLGLVESGTTPLFRSGVLADPDEGNRCPLFVLATPRRRCQIRKPECGSAVNRPLPKSRRDLGKAPRAREGSPKAKSEKARAPRGQPVLPPGTPALHWCPRTRTEALAVAAAVQTRSRFLGHLSIEHLRHLGRPYFAAGWTGADLLHAVDHDIRGRAYGYARAVHSPAAWARARLAAWLGPDGTPLPSRSQLRAADRERAKAEQAARRAEAEALAARRAPGEAYADQVRARHRWRRTTGDSTPRPHRAGEATAARRGGDRPDELEGILAALAGWDRSGLLAGLPDDQARHLTAPFTTAGWPAACIVHAIDYAPDGSQHSDPGAGPREAAAWIRKRLELWLRADGTPLPRPPLPGPARASVSPPAGPAAVPAGGPALARLLLGVRDPAQRQAIITAYQQAPPQRRGSI